MIFLFEYYDLQKVSVSKEVYRAYKRPAWKERKRRKIRAENERSFDSFEKNGFEIPSVISVEEIVANKLMSEKLYVSLNKLPNDERALINALYFENITEHELSRRTGIPRQTIHSRKKLILKKLKKFF